MKRSVIASILACVLLLSSCTAMIESEYTSVTPHAVVDSEQFAEGSAVSCADRKELKDAVTESVLAGESFAQLSFQTYEGDVARDLSEVCIEIPREVPEAAYTVNYITYNLNFIVSYYIADLTITYKRDNADLRSVRSYGTYEELASAISTASAEHSHGFAFYSDGSVTAREIVSIIEESYYSEASAPYIPEADVSFYPSEGAASIVELNLNYPYSGDETSQRKAAISNAADELIASIEETGDAAVTAAARALKNAVSFDLEREEAGDYSRWYNVYTSYGALVQKRAVGEGFALAMKLLCDRLGVECIVVRGMMNSVNHAWNIVKLENGSFYHLDVSMLPDGVIYFTEKELSPSYRWDAAAYPACVGVSLQPAPEPAPVPVLPPVIEVPQLPEEPDSESTEEPIEQVSEEPNSESSEEASEGESQTETPAETVIPSE